MSDPFDAMKQHFSQDQFASENGVRILEVALGRARAMLPIEKRHLNSFGIVQGGAIFMLADFTFAMACNAAGQVALAVNTTCTFLRPTRTGTLYAEATEVSRSRRLSTCSVNVVNEAGDPVALFQATAFIKDEAILPSDEG